MTVLTATRSTPPAQPAPVVIDLCDDDATVAGEFDLRQRLAAVLAVGPARVVVDLGRCRYLDAPGLRVLLEAQERACEQGTRLELQRCSPEVVRLLEAAGHPVDRWGPEPGQDDRPRARTCAARPLPTSLDTAKENA